jgi:hypothetical protein
MGNRSKTLLRNTLPGKTITLSPEDLVGLRAADIPERVHIELEWNDPEGGEGGTLVVSLTGRGGALYANMWVPLAPVEPDSPSTMWCGQDIPVFTRSLVKLRRLKPVEVLYVGSHPISTYAMCQVKCEADALEDALEEGMRVREMILDAYEEKVIRLQEVLGDEGPNEGSNETGGAGRPWTSS